MALRPNFFLTVYMNTLYLPWGKHPSQLCLKCESASRRFQPGEGPSIGLLRDYKPLDGTFSSTNANAVLLI